MISQFTTVENTVSGSDAFTETHEATVMNVTIEASQVISSFPHVKVVLSLLPCLFFLYVNGVMMFTLLKKPFLLESSRYILFGHLLLNDSLQLILTMLLYLLSLTSIKMISYVCITLTLLAGVTVKMSVLNLALMSLERYVAICFPLRHSSIATSRATGIAIAVMWALVSLESITQIFLFVSLENAHFTLQTFCTKKVAFGQQIYVVLDRAFIIANFVLVSIIIIYTYVAVLVTVKSATSSVHKTNKAHKTVLLHLFQLCLCLISTLFSMINAINRIKIKTDLFVHTQYILFLFLIIFPKFLSPLIYGLRDPTFSHVFKYYFTFGFKTTVKPFPKSDISNTVTVL